MAIYVAMAAGDRSEISCIIVESAVFDRGASKGERGKKKKRKPLASSGGEKKAPFLLSLREGEKRIFGRGGRVVKTLPFHSSEKKRKRKE